MLKVSTKQLQRRIAALNARYTVAQPKRPGHFFKRIPALVILAIIAVAAFSYAHRTRSDFVQITLKQDPTTPKLQVSEAEGQAKWNSIWGAASTGFKRGD